MPLFDHEKDKEPDVKASEAPTAEQPAVVDPDAPTTADQPATPPAQPDAEEQSPEDFRRQQEVLAQSQNLTAPNAVPEQRPQAFLEGPGESELTQRLREEGAISDEPMPPEAFQKAASEDQRKEAAENSVSEAIHVGSVVKATKGPHRGRTIAVTRIEEYQNQEDLVNVAAGRPEQRFAHPARVEGSARGDERDGEVLILDTEEAGLEVVRDFLNRRMR